MSSADHAEATAQSTAELAVEQRFMSTERLVFFSDAVVAIALTLLALELPVPAGESNHDVLAGFHKHYEEYLAFLISYAVIGIQWQGHHRTFARVRGLAGRIVTYNLLWLLTIVVTPFATKVLTGDGGFQVRFITYAGVQALSGLFFLLILVELTRHRLRDPSTPRQAVISAYVRIVSMVLAFAISIPVSLFTHLAYACWVGIPLLIRAGRYVVERRL
jgi:TMEM175 potassium channel family protein